MNILDLNNMVLECIQCMDLCGTRKGGVSGIGNSSELMILGEAPGADEDATGEPFVGRCGDLLTKMLSDCGIERDSTYITNVVKCRPTKNNKGKSNRPPTSQEVDNCKRWLWNELKILKPKVILTLGKVPTGLLLKLKKTFKLADYIEKEISLDYMDNTYVVPCYHPSYLMQTGKHKMDISMECIKIAKRRAGI